MPEAGALPNEDFDDDLNPGGGQGQAQQDQEEEGIVLDEQVEAGVTEEDEDEVEEQQNVNLSLEEVDVVGSPRVSINCFQVFVRSKVLKRIIRALRIMNDK